MYPSSLFAWHRQLASFFGGHPHKAQIARSWHLEHCKMIQKNFCLSLHLNSFCSSKSCKLQVRRMWLAKLVSDRKAKTSAVRCSEQENIYVKLCHMAYFCDLLFWPRSVAKQFYYNFYIPKPFRRDMLAPPPPSPPSTVACLCHTYSPVELPLICVTELMQC